MRYAVTNGDSFWLEEWDWTTRMLTLQPGYQADLGMKSVDWMISQSTYKPNLVALVSWSRTKASVSVSDSKVCVKSFLELSKAGRKSMIVMYVNHSLVFKYMEAFTYEWETIRIPYRYDTATIQFRYGDDTVTIRLRYSLVTVTIPLRYGYDTV